MDNKRIIHTNLFSQTAYDAFESVMGQISDGYWENTPRMQKYWSFADIGRAADGEVLVEVEPNAYLLDEWTNRYSSNPYADMSDRAILEFFANKMKVIAKVEMKDKEVGNQWQRDNEMKVHYLSQQNDLDISDIYCIYDICHGRSPFGRYPNAHIDKICGKPNSAVRAA